LVGGQRSKYVSPCVCRGRNAFFFTMSWRASVFVFPLRGEQDEIAEVNVADGALGLQSDDFCENALWRCVTGAGSRASTALCHLCLKHKATYSQVDAVWAQRWCRGALLVSALRPWEMMGPLMCINCCERCVSGVLVHKLALLLLTLSRCIRPCKDDSMRDGCLGELHLGSLNGSAGLEVSTHTVTLSTTVNLYA
jgi:hypothetical protein